MLFALLGKAVGRCAAVPWNRGLGCGRGLRPVFLSERARSRLCSVQLRDCLSAQRCSRAPVCAPLWFRLEAGNRPTNEPDIPIELLRSYFGPEVDRALTTLREHRARAERGESSELMDLLIIYRWADAFVPLEAEASSSPIGK